MKKRFIDTSQAKAVGQDWETKVQYSPVITNYAKDEFTKYGLDTTGTNIKKCPSWDDFTHSHSDDYGNYYEWNNGSSSGKALQIFHYNKPLGCKAPCGHDATGQIFYDGVTFYFCESIAVSSVDLSYVTGSILNLEIKWPDCRDECLGQSCKSYQSQLLLGHGGTS